MTTRPFDLPAVPPSIPDWQKKRVLEAEEAARARVQRGLGSWVEDLQPELGITVRMADGDAAEYWRSSETLVLGRQCHPMLAAHEAAHHLVDPVFPLHGAEWAQVYLNLLRIHLGDEVRSVMAEEFEARQVHCSVDDRKRRVRKGAIFATNKEPGALARVILDEPPQELVCQLMRVVDDGVEVRDLGGEHVLDWDRMRYISYALLERRPSRTSAA